MESAYKETVHIMKQYGITANKKLGQNFLIDDNAIKKIVEAAEVTKEDLVIEIGPGLGTLTAKLLEKAGKVICIELDNRMLQLLKNRFITYQNFEIIHEDVLKVDLESLINQNKEYKKVKVVANLPYYITTPIIMKLLEENLEVESITVMVQKEVAKRITATPGSHVGGAITYSVNYYSQPEEIIEVPSQSFIPAPEVDSEVIKLVLRKAPPVEIKSKEVFFQVIKVSFMQRRKTFINGIINSKLLEKEEIKRILKELEIDERVRGENLTMEQFAEIANKIAQK